MPHGSELQKTRHVRSKQSQAEDVVSSCMRDKKEARSVKAQVRSSHHDQSRPGEVLSQPPTSGLVPVQEASAGVVPVVVDR